MTDILGENSCGNLSMSYIPVERVMESFYRMLLVAAVWLEVSALHGDWVTAVTGRVAVVEAGPSRSGFWIFAKTRRRAATARRSVT